MASDKTLLGDGGWQCDPVDQDCKLKFTLAVDGEPTQFTLEIVDFPMRPAKGFTFLINAPPPIWRLDFDAWWEKHTNDVPEIHECPRIVQGPHFHPWRLNRQFLKRGQLPDELELALPLAGNIQSFDAALRWFADETRIAIGKGQIPARPTPGNLL